MTPNIQELVDAEPLFSCSDDDCRVEASYPANMLRIFEGKPICENCYDENPPFDPVDWHDLSPFIPAYQNRLTTLSNALEVAEGALEAIAGEAERENGRWQHLKRTIAVQSRQALSKIKEIKG